MQRKRRNIFFGLHDQSGIDECWLLRLGGKTALSDLADVLHRRLREVFILPVPLTEHGSRQSEQDQSRRRRFRDGIVSTNP
jgi:hypothetical protein